MTHERRPAGPLAVGAAVIALLLPLVIFLAARVQIPGDGTQATFDLAQIHTTGYVVKSFMSSPDGLQTGDIVEAIEGHSMDDLARDVFLGRWDKPPLQLQQVVQYTILRNGQTKTVPVRVTNFPLIQALLDDWTIHLYFVYQSLLGLLVFARRPRLLSAQLYLLFGTAFVSAAGISFLAFQVSDYFAGWFTPFILLTTIVLSFYAAAGQLHFALIFPRRKALLARHPAALVWVYLGVWLIYAGFMLLRGPSAPTFVALLQVHWQAGYVVTTVYFPFILFSYLSSYRSNITASERRQLRWVLWGYAIGIVPWVVFVIIGSLFGVPFRSNFALLGIFLLAAPTAIAIAIVRERLFDIDIIIRRTLIYSSLTIMLALTYFGSVIGLQFALRTLTGQQDSEIATVVSTLLIAALFVPLRQRVQSAIDRRFYRRKYDAAKTLEAFSTAVRDEVDLKALREHLLGVVHETMQPAHVSLWLRKTENETERT